MATSRAQKEVLANVRAALVSEPYEKRGRSLAVRLRTADSQFARTVYGELLAAIRCQEMRSAPEPDALVDLISRLGIQETRAEVSRRPPPDDEEGWVVYPNELLPAIVDAINAGAYYRLPVHEPRPSIGDQLAETHSRVQAAGGVDMNVVV